MRYYNSLTLIDATGLTVAQTVAVPNFDNADYIEMEFVTMNVVGANAVIAFQLQIAYLIGAFQYKQMVGTLWNMLGNGKAFGAYRGAIQNLSVLVSIVSVTSYDLHIGARVMGN